MTSLLALRQHPDKDKVIDLLIQELYSCYQLLDSVEYHMELTAKQHQDIINHQPQDCGNMLEEVYKKP